MRRLAEEKVMHEDYEVTSRWADREDDSPSEAAKFKKMRGPVGIHHGRKVSNTVSDQRAVMNLLDKLSTNFGGNRDKSTGRLEVAWPAPAEGKCNVVLWSMILRVQNFFYTWGGTMPPPGALGFVPDGVVDPGGKTEQLMIACSGKNPPYPAVGTNPKELAKAAIPTARRWIQGASAYLVRYKTWRQGGKSGSFDDAAVKTHLHLDRISDRDSIGQIDEWIENYRRIGSAFDNAETVFVRTTREEALKARLSMNCWGVMIPAWAIADKNIWFGPDMIGLGMNCRAAILIHEGGHYIRSKIGHQGGERG
jgi:hypothetical protein